MQLMQGELAKQLDAYETGNAKCQIKSRANRAVGCNEMKD